jgi:hypothetical protein
MKTNKVLFLDNDGVICLANNWGSRVNKRKKDKISLVMNDPDVEAKYRFDYFDKKAVKVLNQVLEETGAEIVVSSDWRLLPIRRNHQKTNRIHQTIYRL